MTIERMFVPPPGPHGGDAAALARALGIETDAVLDLSVSLNPVAPDVTPIVREHLHALRRYPDDGAATEAVARALAVDPARVVVTNGGAEAIALVASLQPAGWVVAPEFSLYERHLERVEPGAPRWRANPNNPTGQLAAAADRADVWDEAFYALATGRWTRGDAGVTVVGSLTKVFACPGLRIGYVCAPDVATAGALRARQPRWSLNALACVVTPVLLADAPIDRWAADVAELRDELRTLLVAHGLESDRSDANFVLLRDAPNLRRYLAAAAVLVRDTESFGIAGGVRIGVPDADGLERLSKALDGYHHG
jgi:histidinol-phosphate/aromatic aminotransferase/cobyric acid decarboxylase-like protein